MRSNSTTPRVNRVAGFVAWAACLPFAFGAAWGICKIPGGGHIDSGSVATTTLSEGIARFHLVYPAKYGFTGTMASPPNYYCHHPFGSFYASAICLWLFGDHDFVVHLPAVLMSFAIPPMLYGIGKRIGGAVIGAVAACAYAVVPIALGFASYNNLETPAIFGSLLFFWGHSYHQTTRKAGYGLASLIGLPRLTILNWYFLPLFPMFVVFYVSALAETNRPPFDLVEAESELVAGFMVEYGSTPYLLFMLGEYVAITTMCAMAAILFMGGWLPPIALPPFTWIPGVIWFVLKVFFMFFLFAMAKAIVPRYRYDQLMRLGWKVFLPLSLAMVIVVAGVLHFAGIAPT